GLDEAFLADALPGHRQFRSVAVTAHGFCRDVMSFLRRSDVMCLSSRSEAFPVSLVEALGAGAVCVATDVGDCRDIVGDCGEIVPRGRPDYLADALARSVVESHSRRAEWARRAQDRAQRYFSIETMAAEYERVLSQGDAVVTL